MAMSTDHNDITVGYLQTTDWPIVLLSRIDSESGEKNKMDHDFQFFNSNLRSHLLQKRLNFLHSTNIETDSIDADIANVLASPQNTAVSAEFC
jgi:hypothetical protein